MLELCEALGELDIWVRLHYVYPYPSVDDVIPLMAQGKILPYLDIPLQHANKRILKLMKRPGSAERVLERIQKWREICPDIVIRSTFIVGFPGETEEEFNELLDFLRAAQLDRVGCFTYSPVEGAKANELADPVPAEVQQQRYKQFMQVPQEVSAAKLRARVGQEMLVLIDEVNPEGAVGRSYADAPEIDGLVYISDETDVQPGDKIWVEIIHTDEYDLWGVRVED
jgi:ribosomal protein S12 methylthiotransferase